MGRQWVLYDRQYRREALARRDLNWSTLNSRLYNEAFTGQARTISRCGYCLADDHAANACQADPDAGLRTIKDGTSPPVQHLPSQHSTLPELCRNFNDGRCKRPSCCYQHLCLNCHEGHPWLSCPRRRPHRRGPSSWHSSRHQGAGHLP